MSNLNNFGYTFNIKFGFEKFSMSSPENQHEKLELRHNKFIQGALEKLENVKNKLSELPIDQMDVSNQETS